MQANFHLGNWDFLRKTREDYMDAIQIIATGKAIPKKLVTNDDMSKIVETSDEWISTRTGIRQRYFWQHRRAKGSLLTMLSVILCFLKTALIFSGRQTWVKISASGYISASSARRFSPPRMLIIQ